MEAIDIEAKTIDEAIKKACRKFQASREKLKIEIIAEGTPGFLGFGSKKALIRASILQIDRELDNLMTGGNTPAPVIVPEAPVDPPPAAPSTPFKKESGEKNGGKTETSNRNQEKPIRADGFRVRQQRKPPEPTKTARVERPAATTSMNQPEALKALELLEGILTRMDIPAQVKLQEADDAVMLKIIGDGDGLLIGKKGQNLDAIQHILNKAVHHSINDGKRILIDTEEYRKRQENSLLATALQTAQKVKKTRKPVTLGPMSPHDRRIIHIALKNDKALTTKSRGEGEFRKIVITPTRHGVTDEGI
jgi:spoIIIJ-associated protein